MLSAAVGEATDDGEREAEDHVFGYLPRHRHHLRGVVSLRPHRQDGGGNQTRSAQTGGVARLFVSGMVRCLQLDVVVILGVYWSIE